MNQFVYHDGEDKTNTGLMIPRYRAEGRTSPKGEVYGSCKNEDETDLVPVRSIVTKKDGDLSTVTPDLIGPRVNDFTDGAGVGVSLSTSFTEASTQSVLGLKHGGHERVLDQSGYLKAPKKCKFREEGKWIYLKVRGAELKYPKPDNLVTLGKTEFEEGESTCCLYHTTSPISSLNSLINLMKARPSIGLRFYEKDDIVMSECYAYNEGVIKYVENKYGEIDVYIGDQLYLYNPNCLYYFPDGAKVNKHDRICSGVLRMDLVLSNLGTDIGEIYSLFRKQVYELLPGGFKKTGKVDKDALPEEMIELLFTGLIRVSYDPKTNAIAEIEYQGVQQSIMNKKSFYTVLSYGYGSKVVGRALKGDLNLSGDLMTETILGLLMNNKLDE